jgi:arabinogalactan oligomer/maltooligosaccharide transport system permease protein
MRKLVRQSKLSLPRQLLVQLALALVALYVLVPIWGMVLLAFDGAIKITPTELQLLPKQLSLAPFVAVWQNATQQQPFLNVLKNSLIVAGGAAVLSVAFGASMAYGFARFRFPGRQTGLFLLLVGALLPPVALMTPLYVLLTILQVRTTLFGLMIVYTAIALPFCIWNMRAAFQAVPRELEESAFIDGAGFWTAFTRITLPLALPSILVAALIAFLAGYSEFAMGWLFIQRGDNITLAMALAVIVNGTVSRSSLAALTLLMSVPVVILFIFLQRYLLDRLLVGSAD